MSVGVTGRVWEKPLERILLNGALWVSRLVVIHELSEMGEKTEKDVHTLIELSFFSSARKQTR